jgi:MSHA biogenesis protein MshP
MKSLRTQAGVALVTAIFLLVVLAGLAVAVVSLTSAQQDTAVKDEMGTRAYLAAKAGMDWALFTALQGGVGATNFDRLNCAGGAQSFTLPRGTTLSVFTVTVECSPAGQNASYGSAPTLDHFRITVTACNAAACPAANPGPDYVQRAITAQL